MITASMKLPSRHVTIRVAWYDKGWNGRVCTAPSTNPSDLVLSPITAGKRDDQDECAVKPFEQLAASVMPARVDERVSFMADHALVLERTHPYKISSAGRHGDFGETTVRLEAVCAARIPLGWTLTSNVEGDGKSGGQGKTAPLRLGHEAKSNPELSFKIGSRQDKANQLVMLDTLPSAELEGSIC